ncbi:DHA2 family efflux MFS transporter permease subunit [Kitasatospora sp. RG8]|uniref:DHA2 family efflux MFS transporter permease subunit n=1 Tax=Kitasatospora sp. RG8 TaxID=2820815 RepID=UPI001ADFF622|nr:DHA2 family efflux MFS transporter permease subunit [Kitasatospora sp. RG8]MBP0455286.1 DHA2 family efflux MFS transporter permease subunit [Kitasatospora sp. RG8]
MTTHAPTAPRMPRNAAPRSAAPRQAAPHGAGREAASTRSRVLALAVLCAGMLMIVLDGSIVTVALPAIQADLGFTPAGLTWTVNAYLIAFAGLLLLAGRLGDLIGRKKVFVAGLALFTAASLLCAVATGQGMLVAARFLQGVGGAMASAVSLGMIVTLFPEPGERGRAIGAFSFVGATGASVGQVLGGVLTEVLNWHWIFLINLPLGLTAALLAVRVLGSDRGPGLRAGADSLGAVLITAALMLGIYTVVGTGESGWTSARTLGLGALSAVLLAAFLRRQARAAHPLLPLRMFRSRNVSGANAVQVLTISGMFGFQILVALYLQNVLGYGAAATGLAMLPAAVAIGAVSLLLSARLNARFGERNVLLAGLALLVAALGLLTRLPADADYAVHLLPTMLLIGGGGLVLSGLTALGMSGASADDAGTASGLFNTTQQIGAALGVAVLTTLATSRATTLTAAGHSAADALTGGFRLAFAVSAGLLAVALLLTAVVLKPARPAADRPAAPVL